MELTLGATPSTDVAGVVVGQDLVGRGKDTKLDVVVEGGVRGETQESNVVSEELDHNVNTSKRSLRSSKREMEKLRHQLLQYQLYIVIILK